MHARLQVLLIKRDQSAAPEAIDETADQMLRFENTERYIEQSAATLDGKRAEIPARSKVLPFVRKPQA